MAPPKMPKPYKVQAKKTHEELTATKHEREQDEKIKQLELNVNRQDKRARAVLNLSQFESKVMGRAESWIIAATNVGSAYNIAATKYNATLSKKAAQDARDIQLFFSVLTVVSVGALAWVSKAAAISSLDPGGVETALRGAIEDTAQAGAGATLSLIATTPIPPSTDAVSQDPQIYQNQLVNKIRRIKIALFESFDDFKGAWKDAPLSAWDDFDENKQLTDYGYWTRQADEQAGEKDLPSVDWMADELERGLWQKYVLEKHSMKIDISRGDALYVVDSPDNVGTVVVVELRRLGILSKKPGPYEGEGAVNPRALWNWAKTYSPKEFVAQQKELMQGGPPTDNKFH